MKLPRLLELLLYTITLPVFLIFGLLAGFYIFIMFWVDGVWQTWKMRNKLYYWEEPDYIKPHKQDSTS